jgi:hypothetical protein
MSSESPTSNPNPQRPSRFIEGEPLTHSPSSATNPLLASILSEQDQHESLRRSNSRSRQGSSSSTNSSHSQPPTSTETSPQKQPIKSTRPVESMDWTAKTGPSSDRAETGRSSLQEGRLKETTSEKIVGRIRALTGSHSGLERKIQKGEVVPYPGT